MADREACPALSGRSPGCCVVRIQSGCSADEPPATGNRIAPKLALPRETACYDFRKAETEGRCHCATESYAPLVVEIIKVVIVVIQVIVEVVVEVIIEIIVEIVVKILVFVFVLESDIQVFAVVVRHAKIEF